MKKLVFAGLLLTVFCLPLVAAGVARPNLIKLHADLSAVPVKNCIACHGDKAKEKSLSSKIQSYHAKHLNSRAMKFDCHTCHKKADLREESAETFRKQVDSKLCAECHSTQWFKEVE